jgi:hypothetical protein
MEAMQGVAGAWLAICGPGKASWAPLGLLSTEGERGLMEGRRCSFEEERRENFEEKDVALWPMGTMTTVPSLQPGNQGKTSW